MTTRTLRKLFAFAVPLLAAALFGCNSSPPPSGGEDSGIAFSGSPTPDAKRLTLLAVDRSRSTEGIRRQLLSTTFDIGTSFDPARDTFRLYRFGNTIEEVYSQLPEDDDDFSLVLADKVKANDPVPGTNYPLVVETLAAAAADASQKEIRIVIVGDGLNDIADDPRFEHRYRLAAARLARNPRIKWVRFWGVAVGTREEIRSVFRPLGTRLQLQSLDQNPLAP